MEDWLAYPGIADQPEFLQFPDAGPNPTASTLERDEPGIAQEALARGADTGTIEELLLRRRYPSAARTPAGRSTMPTLDDYLQPRSPRPDYYADARQALREPVELQIEAYHRKVDDEFAGLPDIVQRGFQSAQGEPFAPAQQRYLEMRSQYYRAGWRCPKKIFDRIRGSSEGAVLLGYPIVGGAHEELLTVVKQLPEALDARKPGLAERIRQQIFKVTGFVPRVIAGSAELSNHAFGLALDIDAAWNPQFKDPAVLEVLKRVTGVDFGRRLVPTDATERTNSAMTHLETASERLKLWLAKALPTWETRCAGLRAQKAKQNATKTKSERQQALTELKAAQAALDADPDAHGIDILVRAHTELAVRAWAAYGITTIPRELVDAFKELGKTYGARWGGEYESTKDGMHLELIAARAILREGRPTPDLTDLETGPAPAKPRCAESER